VENSSAAHREVIDIKGLIKLIPRLVKIGKKQVNLVLPELVRLWKNLLKIRFFLKALCWKQEHFAELCRLQGSQQTE
jgi:hypothetical protein